MGRGGRERGTGGGGEVGEEVKRQLPERRKGKGRGRGEKERVPEEGDWSGWQTRISSEGLLVTIKFFVLPAC